MATTTTITKLLFRRGNDSDRKQTILASGEPGWVLDTKRLWIGDGVTPGGVPALSARADHLHYVDTPPGTNRRWTTQIDNLKGGAQFLDINIIGLSQTLAGDPVDPDKYLRWFHPAAKDIRTSKDLIFTNDANFDGSLDGGEDRNESAAIYHEGNKEFFIGKRNNSDSSDNTINIGDAIIITPLPGNKSKVSFTDDVTFAAFTAVSAIFDNGTHTLFEDKSVDLNTSVKTLTASDGSTYKELEPHTVAPTSEGTGLYFAHQNYLSAGCIAVGKEQSEFGYGSIQIRPTKYRTGWEIWDNHSFGGTVPDGAGGFLGRTSTYTATPSWNNQQYTEGEEGASTALDFNKANGWMGGDNWRPKELVFHSVRPDGKSQPTDQWGSSYFGNTHLVFESGLIVYDAGDPTTGKYNAYKINQSLDTRAAPRFTGLKIRTDLHETNNREVDGGTARLGTAIPVDSGGTGMNEFTPGSVIRTTGNWDDPQQINDDALTSIRLEQGAFLVGTNEHGAVAHRFTTSDWIRIDYGDGTLTNDQTGRRDGVIELNNTFAPDFLDTDNETRELWFTKFNRWTADDAGVITAVGQIDGKDPGETVTFLGDSFKSSVEGVISTGGTIRTKALDSATPDNKKIKIIHNDLASVLYGEGTVNELVLKFQREDGVENVKVREIFAGQTYTNPGGDDAYERRYLNGLMPVTSTDTNHDTPDAFDNKGFVLAGVQIDKGGHLIGVRSKDLDDRYPQMFFMGTGWNSFGQQGVRIQSPDDHDADVSTLTDTDIGDSEIGTKVIHNNSVTENAYVPKGYMGDKLANTVVLTDINFNNYGTVYSYGSHDLTNIFYDKQQINSLATQIYTHVDQLSATIDDVQDNTFKRDASSETFGTNITTSWLQQNKAEWSHNANSGSRIYQKSLDILDENDVPVSTTVEWVFDADEHTDIYVPTNKSIEWRHKSTGSSGDTTKVMMSLQAQADGDTLLDVLHDNKTRFRFDKSKLFVKSAAETDNIKITIDSSGITLGDGGADDVRVKGTAARAESIWTRRANVTEATKHHVGFVENNNSATANSSGAQTLKTDANITYDPHSNILEVSGDIVIPGTQAGGYDGEFKGKLAGSASHVDVWSTHQVNVDTQTAATTLSKRDSAKDGDVVDRSMYLTFVRNNNAGANNGEELMFTHRDLSFDGEDGKMTISGTGGAQIYGDLMLGADKDDYANDTDVKILFHDTTNSKTELENGSLRPDYWNEIKWDSGSGEFQIHLDMLNKHYAILHDGNLNDKLALFLTELPAFVGNGDISLIDGAYLNGDVIGDIYADGQRVNNAGDPGKKVLENGTTDGSDAWFCGDVVKNDGEGNAKGTVLVDISEGYFKGVADEADKLHTSAANNSNTYRVALSDTSNGDHINYFNTEKFTATTDSNGNVTLSCNINNAIEAEHAGKVDTVKKQSANEHYITFVADNNSTAAEESVHTHTGIKYSSDTSNNGTLTVSQLDGNAATASKVYVSNTDDKDNHSVLLSENLTDGGARGVERDASLYYNASNNTLFATKFSGDGSGLTDLNVSEIDNVGKPMEATSSIGNFHAVVYDGVDKTTPKYTSKVKFNPHTGAGLFDGDVTAYASDQRLKENIKPIDDALEKLSKIGGYTFNFNELGQQLVGQTDKQQVGVLAQEVEQVLPEVIAPAPSDENYKTVKYEKLVPLLIESIKQLSARVEQLESQLK